MKKIIYLILVGFIILNLGNQSMVYASDGIEKEIKVNRSSRMGIPSTTISSGKM